LDRGADAERRTLPVFAEPGVPLRATPRSPPRAVRLSITDRCDLACTYCRPSRHDGYLPAQRRLTPSDWVSLVTALVRVGVDRVRITGGEPLLHPDVVEIVARIAAVPGVRDLALTTNGTQLAALASPLRAAGLQRLNVSLDSLDPLRFFRLSRGGCLDDVLAGFEAARRAGFAEIKTNTLALAGENDDELVRIIRWVWSMGATPRLLELMAVGEGARLRERVLPYAELRARLAALIEDDAPAREPNRGPARYVRARDGVRRVGFITGASETFCEGCDRLRVSSDGQLRACLASNDAVDASRAIRAGDIEAIAAQLDVAWAQKPDGETWRGCAETSAARVDMRSTGG
jgi:cyclic pyranopterin phosphate synthase